MKKNVNEKIMKNEFVAKLIVSCEPVSSLPEGLMNYNNPIMSDLPRKRHINIDDVVIEFNSPKNETEKRLVIGEHNGERWLGTPQTTIMQFLKRSDTTVLRAETLKLAVYLKVKIELEEIIWTGNVSCSRKFLDSKDL